MSENDYTCFVISPIGNRFGDKEEQVRFDAFKRVYEYLIMRSLRLAGFKQENIIRSGVEIRGGKITENIMGHLKNDDLCIADLTDLNPNVMYEYGVRVGVGKPVITIASHKTVLPFDVKDVRTVIYNMDNIENVMECQETLEARVKVLIDEGFSPQSGTGSFVDLSERLQRIEGELAQLVARSGGSGSAFQLNGNAEKVIRELGSTIAAFNYALRNRDVRLGEDLMPRLKDEISEERYIDAVVAQLTALGSKKAAAELKASWGFIKENLTLQQQYEEIACYVSFCNRSDKEEDEMGFISEELNELEKRVNESELSEEEKNELKSGIYNQANRLYYGAYETASREHRETVHTQWLFDAIKAIEKAVELNPSEASYYYNLAICYRKLGNMDKAVMAIDKCVELGADNGNYDSDHLSLAYKIYIDSGEGEKARSVKEKLEAVNPYRAAIL